MPDFPLRELIAQYPRAMAAIFGAIGLCMLAFLVGAWLIFGRGPRRRRGMRVARRLLRGGAWHPALEQLRQVRAIGSPSASWRREFDRFEAECLQTAAKQALAEKRFEEALKFGQR